MGQRAAREEGGVARQRPARVRDRVRIHVRAPGERGESRRRGALRGREVQRIGPEGIEGDQEDRNPASGFAGRLFPLHPIVRVRQGEAQGDQADRHGGGQPADPKSPNAKSDHPHPPGEKRAGDEDGARERRSIPPGPRSLHGRAGEDRDRDEGDQRCGDPAQALPLAGGVSAEEHVQPEQDERDHGDPQLHRGSGEGPGRAVRDRLGHVGGRHDAERNRERHLTGREPAVARSACGEAEQRAEGEHPDGGEARDDAVHQPDAHGEEVLQRGVGEQLHHREHAEGRGRRAHRKDAIFAAGLRRGHPRTCPAVLVSHIPSPGFPRPSRPGAMMPEASALASPARGRESPTSRRARAPGSAHPPPGGGRRMRLSQAFCRGCMLPCALIGVARRSSQTRRLRDSGPSR